jgi:fluoride ion exporter CrcB/FEX
MARYGTALIYFRPGQPPKFPWATLTANLIGCLLIGFVNGAIG